MDVGMPIMGGEEATRTISRDHPAMGVIGLSLHSEMEMGEAMRRAGATCYLSKSGPPSELRAAIHRIFSGAA
jgi:DNA-binding NarL/FixJ family response regulator